MVVRLYVDMPDEWFKALRLRAQHERRDPAALLLHAGMATLFGPDAEPIPTPPAPTRKRTRNRPDPDRISAGALAHADELRDLVAQNLTTTEIAERMGIHRRTIAAWRHQLGISAPKGRPYPPRD